MRVSSEGTRARCKHYSDDPATAGLVLTSTGEDGFPTWGSPGGDQVWVTKVVFVDAGAVALGANGSLSHPWQTINAAIADVLARDWNSAVIMIAPGTYAENVVVPDDATLTDLVFQAWNLGMMPSWGPEDLPILSGSFTITGSVAQTVETSFAGLHLAGDISSGGVSGDFQLVVAFDRCRIDGDILGTSVDVSMRECDVRSPTINGQLADLQIHVDSTSWRALIDNAVALTPDTYTREFYGVGCDIWDEVIDVQGVAIGAFTMLTFDIATARESEYCIATKTTVGGGVEAEYSLTFSHTDLGHAYFQLLNISRASTNFNDEMQLVIFHNGMAMLNIP
jgi:hypothetical protein